MGAFVSVSGHPSHPEHKARYTRFVSNKAAPPCCRICQLNVEIGTPAYGCMEPGGCAVVLHETCYDRPETLRRHLGHPQHRLILTGGDNLAGLSCSLCARDLGTPPVAYSCTRSRNRCAGFQAHPRCCDLPRRLTAPPELHEHADLVLCSPPSGGKKNRRSCIKCKRVATTTHGQQAAPWSYQCPKCDDAEYCLACLRLRDDDAANMRCCCFQCCTVDPAAVRCLGHLAGEFFCSFLFGMLGCPGNPLNSVVPR